MAMWKAHPQLLAATVGRGHVGLGLDFIDKDQECRIEINLPIGPCLALHQDIGAVQFRRMACEEALQGAVAETATALNQCPGYHPEGHR